jgi:hypothetical protein
MDVGMDVGVSLGINVGSERASHFLPPPMKKWCRIQCGSVYEYKGAVHPRWPMGVAVWFLGVRFDGFAWKVSRNVGQKHRRDVHLGCFT